MVNAITSWEKTCTHVPVIHYYYYTMNDEIQAKLRSIEKYTRKVQDKVLEITDLLEAGNTDVEVSRRPRRTPAAAAASDYTSGSRAGGRQVPPPMPVDDRGSMLSTVSMRQPPATPSMSNWGENLSYLSTNFEGKRQ